MKSFQNGKSRDTCGFISELFKMGDHSLLTSILIMINYIKKKNIPEIWDNVIIQTIYKNKGSKKKLENYRGIFITLILSKILEKLIQLRIKNKMTEYSSPFQAGGTPNRSTADNLFLLRGIIDHTIYLNTSMHLTFLMTSNNALTVCG